MTNDEFRTALDDLKINQAWLAARLGVAKSTVSRWTRGVIPVAPYAAFVIDLLRERKEIADRFAVRR